MLVMVRMFIGPPVIVPAPRSSFTVTLSPTLCVPPGGFGGTGYSKSMKPLHTLSARLMATCPTVRPSTHRTTSTFLVPPMASRPLRRACSESPCVLRFDVLIWVPSQKLNGCLLSLDLRDRL